MVGGELVRHPIVPFLLRFGSVDRRWLRNRHIWGIVSPGSRLAGIHYFLSFQGINDGDAILLLAFDDIESGEELSLVKFLVVFDGFPMWRIVGLGMSWKAWCIPQSCGSRAD